MTTEDIRKTAKEYRWAIAASLFFIVWKFFLIGILWDGRTIPPEPDDSFQYIADIASVTECHTGFFCPYPGVSMTDASGFTYLTYKMFLGAIGIMTGLSPDTVFRTGFYIGTILLTFLFLPFLKSFTDNRKLIAWSILFLAFYHGTGETHGFFWVVPSFCSMLLFFMLFLFVTGRFTGFGYRLAAVVAIAFVFSHPISVYLVFMLPIYIGILSILSRELQTNGIKKTIFLIAIVILSATGQSLYLKHFWQINSYGLGASLSNAQTTVSELYSETSTAKTTPNAVTYDITDNEDADLFTNKLETLKAVYFRYVIPHWSAAFLLVGVLLLLIAKRQYRLVSFYVSSLIFFVIATFLNTFGFRSAIILWPVTFIVYAFGSWYILIFAIHLPSPFLKRVMTASVVLAVIIFFGINTALALIFNTNLNLRHKYDIDPRFSEYLRDNMKQDDKVSLNVILVRTPGGADLYLNRKVTSPSERPTFITVIDESLLNSTENESSPIRSSSGIIADLLGITIHPTSALLPTPVPRGYSLEQQFGVVKIYRNND